MLKRIRSWAHEFSDQAHHTTFPVIPAGDWLMIAPSLVIPELVRLIKGEPRPQNQDPSKPTKTKWNQRSDKLQKATANYSPDAFVEVVADSMTHQDIVNLLDRLFDLGLESVVFDDIAWATPGSKEAIAVLSTSRLS